MSADLDRVRVVCDGAPVADHPRVWAKHQTISDPAHVEAAKTLRQQRLAVVPPPAQTLVEQRSLNTYDAAFGLTEEVR